jgi:2-haloacid dehalogenase
MLLIMVPVPAKPQAYLFDAYGTLFNVDSVMRRGASGIRGDLQVLSQLWRRKQLEYTWQRALMERYEDFWFITQAALKTALQQLSIHATAGQIQSLMEAYLSLDAFDDVKPALEGLKGSPAILSNGSPAMLDPLIGHNALESCFTQIISVDQVKTYKPSPRVYALGPAVLKLPAQEILFVSSNQWDAAGAKAFGYQVCWCNRSGAEMEDLGFAPDFVIRDLTRFAKSALPRT